MALNNTATFGRLVGLFVGYAKIAAFTLGGGMVMLPLIEQEFVHKRRWLDPQEFLDIVALINSLPGVITVNSSLIIGRKVAGGAGAIFALLGGMLPSVTIMLLLAPAVAAVRAAPATQVAFTALRAAVAGLILRLIVRQGRKMNAGWKEASFAVFALLAVRILGLHPILIVPFAAVAGVLLYRNDKTVGEPQE